jgi:hypothetical protein
VILDWNIAQIEGATLETWLPSVFERLEELSRRCLARFPEFIEWCATLAGRIASNRDPITQSGLDYLAVGEEIQQLPPNIIDVSWDPRIYRSPRVLRYVGAQGPNDVQLLDCDLAIEPDENTEEEVRITISHDAGFRYQATFSFETDRYFEPATQHESEATIIEEFHETPLIQFLNGEMPLFYTADLALLQGNSLLRRPPDDQPAFDNRLIEIVDWAASNVDIAREFGEGRNGRISVHAGLEDRLRNGPSAVVYYDHGSGEIADFVALERRGERLLVQLYHCKGATGAGAGHRLADIYEITGQAVKSVTWALKQRIAGTIRRRFTHGIGSHRFIKGDLDALEHLLSVTTAAQIDFEFIAAQPGLLKDGLPAPLSNLLAASSDYLVRGGFQPLRVLASERA